jgi:hypothetical protein
VRREWTKRQKRTMQGMLHRWNIRPDKQLISFQYRNGLMFYELDFDDPLGLHPWKRNDDGIPKGTFQGDVNAMAQITLLVDPGATLVDEGLVEGSSAMSTMRLLTLPNLLPDG